MTRLSSPVLVLLYITLTYARPQQNGNQQTTALPIAILSQENVKSEDGSYKYNFETENGIRFQEQVSFLDIPKLNIRGGLKDESEDDSQSGPAIVARGSFSYIAPDGTPINLSYIADQNGFQPVGDHLPTPHPIPEVIQRAISLLPQEYKKEQQ